MSVTDHAADHRTDTDHIDTDHVDIGPAPDTDLDTIRQAILECALVIAPFEGWSVDTLRRAATDAGYDRSTQRRAFPKGVADIIDWMADRDDQTMEARLSALDLPSMRIRDKITEAVRTRIIVMAPHKDAAYRASQFLASPLQAPEAARQVGRTCDRIWRAIGDSSTDFNFYTKRATLAAVYGATVLVWFDDRSQGHAQTWAFLDRRIANVMSFEKLKAQVRDGAAKLPSPLAALAALRYPARRGR